MTPIVHGAMELPQGVGTKAKLQDLKGPIRAVIHPEDDSYHVFALPWTFAWNTISIAPEGTATIYFTISSPESIRSDTAIWHEWGQGTISEPSWHEWENPWLAMRVDCDATTIVEIAGKYG